MINQTLIAKLFLRSLDQGVGLEIGLRKEKKKSVMEYNLMIIIGNQNHHIKLILLQSLNYLDKPLKVWSKFGMSKEVTAFENLANSRGRHSNCGTVVGNSPFILYTKYYFVIFQFACFHGSICHIKYTLVCILWFQRRKLSQSQEKWKKQDFSCTKYGELPTTCHYFAYCPLLIARFQNALTYYMASLVKNFHWFILIIKDM